VTVAGRVQGVFFRDTTCRRALELGLAGWVRNDNDGSVRVHAEGPADAIELLLEFLAQGPPAASVESVAVEEVKIEGHEQFAIRGVSAGLFVVREHAAPSHHFDLRLEVGGTMRSWALPKGPSMDPAVKRFAVETPDHPLDGADEEGRDDDSASIVWDRGPYEQGGRVPWPEAIERGHAVFVLHGEKLRGGFALQRTGGGAKPRWLLVKRKDDHARSGSDVVADEPRSVVSGMTLAERLD
jgi:DNA ligase D-like protein (predicted 3'-phosphoesterase)